MTFTLAIVGSRSLERDKDARFMAEGFAESAILWADLVISGGARGVDTWAREWAKELGRSFAEYPVTPKMYEAFGKSAPLNRNERIARECDEMLAFWDGKSTGTLHALRCARNEGKRWKCLRWDGVKYHLVEDLTPRREKRNTQKPVKEQTATDT